MFTSHFQVQQERKTAERLASRSGLPYSAGFVGELAGKRVCHGNCGPNPQTAGHLGCLLDCVGYMELRLKLKYIWHLIPCLPVQIIDGRLATGSTNFYYDGGRGRFR